MEQGIDKSANYCTPEHRKTVATLEARTGLDLFPRFEETTVREKLGPALGCLD